MLEDYHGKKQYPTPAQAWRDYVKATLEYYGSEYMPQEFEEAKDLGVAMADYYELWLQGRESYETYYHEGVPQTEVNFKIAIPVDPVYLATCGFDTCYYEGTIDRVVIDGYGNLWIVEYKTAAQIFEMHYLTDPQVTSYCWAAQMLYGRPVVGCIYMQWRKDVPSEPRLLKSGKLSLADNQKTTHRQYRDSLIRIYGDIQRAPKDYVDFLNTIAAQENPDYDGFVRRDKILRNQQSLQSEGVKILMEVTDMLNPELPLYPNPDRMCHWCDMREACINLDDGSDWESEIEDNFEPSEHQRGRDPWRTLLQYPTQPKLMVPPPNQSWLGSSQPHHPLTPQ